jgi:hypothetical protein
LFLHKQAFKQATVTNGERSSAATSLAMESTAVLFNSKRMRGLKFLSNKARLFQVLAAGQGC